MTNKIIPVILCGGSGTRLWPISRDALPKQFLELKGENSLIQETALRSAQCSGANPEDFVTVTLGDMKKDVVQQLAHLDRGFTSHVLGEPVARNTAAAVAYAALYVQRHFGSDAIMWVLPSDHYMADKGALKQALDKAVVAAKQDYLVTYGITPSRPETGYGYIKKADSMGIDDSMFHVDEFVEKPSLGVAQEYIVSGDFLWNSGMFVFSAGTVIDNFRKHAPAVLRDVQQAVAQGRNEYNPSFDVYEGVEQIPFDKAIMERSGKVAVVPCDPAWSDIGSWESLWEISDKDKHGNAIVGEAICYESTDCIVHAQERLVTCAGLDNIVIAETADAVMVADKSNSDGIKAIVNALKKEGRREVSEPQHECRPWGEFKILSQSEGYKIKEIVVKPGETLSLQMHHHRAEFWIVISGEATAQVDDLVKTVLAGEMVYIPVQAKHRLANHGREDLSIVEVQCGSYLGEDDIVRFDDVYGRTAA